MNKQETKDAKSFIYIYYCIKYNIKIKEQMQNKNKVKKGKMQERLQLNLQRVD